jgi:hypothetical protein
MDEVAEVRVGEQLIANDGLYRRELCRAEVHEVARSLGHLGIDVAVHVESAGSHPLESGAGLDADDPCARGWLPSDLEGGTVGVRSLRAVRADGDHLRGSRSFAS